jgi:transmembrane 9 superfamily member 2/4
LPMLLSVFVGTGVQLICMSVATLTFTMLGLLSPENRGSLTTAFILLFVFMGSFAGYHSSSIYKMFRGTEWQRTTVLTAFFFPGVVFVVYFTLNFALLMEGSSGATPLSTFFTLLFLWFCVSVPLVFIGSYFGYRAEVPTHPVRTNQIPRLIPTQQWYLHPFITIALGGILPFGAVSVELFFILSALWLHQIYYIFGFLFLVMIVLIVTCAEISILLCYFHLCAEDYHWWWRSFLTAGSCAGYTLLYSFWYYLTKLDMTEFLPTLIYFGYMSIASLTFFLITGTIGFYSCFWFNTQIYGSIKVD